MMKSLRMDKFYLKSVNLIGRLKLQRNILNQGKLYLLKISLRKKFHKTKLNLKRKKPKRKSQLILMEKRKRKAKRNQS